MTLYSDYDEVTGANAAQLTTFFDDADMATVRTSVAAITAGTYSASVDVLVEDLAVAVVWLLRQRRGYQ